MKILNAALRALFALLFSAIAFIALWLIASGLKTGGEASLVRTIAGPALTAGLSGWAAYMFGRSAREVAAGRKAPGSTAAMAVTAAALGLFIHKAHNEVLGPMSRLGRRGVRAELGTMRGAPSIDSGGTEGTYPADLSISTTTESAAPLPWRKPDS